MSALNLIYPRADRLKDIIDLHGLTVPAAAGRIGCAPQTLRRALAGEPMSAGFVAETTVAFGTTFDALFRIDRAA